MAIIRNARKAHFTIVPNEGLRSDGLSLQAKGLLALMLSFPDDWQYNLKHLETLSTNGRDAHRTALNELIEAGYAVWRTVHKEDGTLAGRELVVSDTPLDHRAPEKPSDGGTVGLEINTTVGLKNRAPEKPSVGKPAPTNTDLYKEPLDKDSSSSAASSPEREPRAASEEAAAVEASKEGPTHDLTPSQASAYRLGRGRGQTTSHLSTFHPDAFQALVTFRKLHGEKANDHMFLAWADSVRLDIHAHGERVVIEALEATIENFPSLAFPFKFYRGCLKQARPQPATNGQATAATPNDGGGLDQDAIARLISEAKEGTLA